LQMTKFFRPRFTVLHCSQIFRRELRTFILGAGKGGAGGAGQALARAHASAGRGRKK
jgi:hypothetical protein